MRDLKPMPFDNLPDNTLFQNELDEVFWKIVECKNANGHPKNAITLIGECDCYFGGKAVVYPVDMKHVFTGTNPGEAWLEEQEVNDE